MRLVWLAGLASLAVFTMAAAPANLNLPCLPDRACRSARSDWNLNDTFTVDLNAGQITQVFPSIEDGNFRIKIIRDSVDFYVGSGSVSIDANLVPEPGTLATIAIGFVLIVAGVHRRRRM